MGEENVELMDLIDNQEMDMIMRDTIKESEFSEWLKEDTMVLLDNAFDTSVNGLIPIALEYSNNYWQEVHSYEPFADISEKTFRTWFTWALTNFMKQCLINYQARNEAYGASEDIKDSVERDHVYERVYHNASDKPIHRDETLEAILNYKIEEVKEVQK